MGLPPSLLDYAENIWRRFPEAFFALGVPQLEDVFEVNKGSWRYRIVDTSAEKVVEIVLPRRKKEGLEAPPGSFFKSEEVENHRSLPSESKASIRAESSLHGVLWDSGRQAVGTKLATRVGKLGLDISNMQKSIKESVSREIQSQLREVQLRNDSSTLGCPIARLASSGSLIAAETGRQLSSSVDTSLRGAGAEEADIAAETSVRSLGSRTSSAINPPSPTETVVSWTSSLAHRRGVSVCSIDLARLEKKDGGPDSVKRSPLLARTAAEQEGNFQMPHEQDDILLQQPHVQVAYFQPHHQVAAFSSTSSAEPAEALSPGTELMMRARRRNERHRGRRADKLEKSEQSRGADKYGDADESVDTPQGVNGAPDGGGFESYWKSVNSGIAYADPGWDDDVTV